MYHYVRNMHETEYPEIKGRRIDEFKKQLAYVTQNYKVISMEEYMSYLNGEGTIPNNAAVLSFDDGLKDHYTNVFPLLQDHKVPGCFFPITCAVNDFKVPAVQKVHFLLAKAGTQEIADAYNTALKEKFPERYDQYYVSDRNIPENKKRWGDRLTRNLKYLIGILDNQTKNTILDEIFGRFFDDEKSFCQKLYMNWEEMKEMRDAGMNFGGHTHTHPMLAALSSDKQQSEITHSKNILENNLKMPINMFSYPYGSFNNETINLLKKAGYRAALTTQKGSNEGKIDPYHIKRHDTNDIPFE